MKKNLWTISSAAIAVCIIGIIIWSTSAPKPQKAPAVPSNGKQEVLVQTKEVVNFVEVEKTITAEMIRENLRNMGFLITQEYDFTEVINYSKEESRFFILKGKAGFVGSYDGVITAGIDFTQIQVTKDSDSHQINIRLPKSVIRNVDVDPDSFILYSEDSKWGTHVTVADFAESLSTLESNARNKAIDRGILEKADDNARTLVRNFVLSMTDPSTRVIIETV